MNFGYLIEDKLAGSAHPGYGDQLHHSLQELSAEGITGVLSLTAEGLPEQLMREYGLRALHLGVADFMPPAPEQIEEGVAFLRREIEGGGKALVHCGWGYGRTGTMLACYLAAMGMDAEVAIDTVRARRPGSIETVEQEDAVRSYAQGLRKRK